MKTFGLGGAKKTMKSSPASDIDRAFASFNAFTPGLLRSKGSSRFSIMKPTKLALHVGRACLFAGSLLGGVGISGAVFDHSPYSPFPILLGAVLIAIYLVMSIPHNRAAHLIQDLMESKDWDRRRDAVLLHYEDERVGKELSWCSNVFDNVTSRTGSWKEPELRFYDDRKEAMQAIRVFSMGLVEPDERVFFPTYSDVSEREGFNVWKEKVEKERIRAEAISTIWQTVLSPSKIQVWLWDQGNAESVLALGKRHGIDIMIESYLEGVPLNMVTAGFADEEAANS